jgi:hypothetical protein
MNRGSVLLRRLLVSLGLVGILTLTFPSMAPTRAWARTAPTTVAFGDPTGGEDSPNPGPSKGTGMKMSAVRPSSTYSPTISLSGRDWLTVWMTVAYLARTTFRQ